MSPELFDFAGIKWVMYNRNEHAAPHVHVYYSGHSACIAIRSLRITKGSLPRTQAVIAKQWIEKHHEELLQMWDNRMKPGGIYYIKD